MPVLKKCLGIDLGTSAVKLVELVVDRAAIRVVNAVSRETGLEAGATPEQRRDAIERTTKELLREARTSTKDAIFGLPGQKVFIRRFRLPDTTDERLEKIVNYEARQQIPFPLEKTDLQFQYFRLPETKEVEVLLTAVRNEEIAEFMALASRTGLKIAAVGVGSFALFNTQAILDTSADKLAALIDNLGKKEAAKPAKGAKVAAEEEAAEEAALEEVKANVHVGASSFDLVISHRARRTLLKFSRSVPNVGGNELTRAIMNACEVPSFADAEAIKRHQTKAMTMEFNPTGEENLNPDSCAAATQAIDRLVVELRRSLDFFISQQDGMSVDGIVLSGGQALLPGLDAYLEEKLAVPTMLMAGVPEGSGLQWQSSEPLTTYAAALGLAIQGVGLGTASVDFLPRERKITRDFPYKSVAIMGALLAGAVGLGSLVGSESQAALNGAAGSVQSQLSINRPQKTAVDQLVQAQQEVSGLYDVIEQGVVDRAFLIDQLVTLNELKPTDVVLVDVQMGHTGNVRVRGVAGSQRSAADFANALKDAVKVTNPAEAPQLSGNLAPIANYPGFQGQAFGFTIIYTLPNKPNPLKMQPPFNPATAGQPGVGGVAPGGLPGGGPRGGLRGGEI